MNFALPVSIRLTTTSLAVAVIRANDLGVRNERGVGDEIGDENAMKSRTSSAGKVSIRPPKNFSLDDWQAKNI